MIAWLLLAKVGSFDIREWGSVLPAGIGFGLMSVALAYGFGRYHGGNTP